MDANFFSLCQLSQEYQVDWLLNSISENLKEIKFSNLKDQNRKILKLINISNQMGWKNLRNSFMNQITDSFIILQTYSEFSELCDDLKVLIARQRFWKIILKVRRCGSFMKWLCNTKDTSLLSILQDYNQEDVFDNFGELDS